MGQGSGNTVNGKFPEGLGYGNVSEGNEALEAAQEAQSQQQPQGDGDGFDELNNLASEMDSQQSPEKNHFDMDLGWDSSEGESEDDETPEGDDDESQDDPADDSDSNDSEVDEEDPESDEGEEGEESEGDEGEDPDPEEGDEDEGEGDDEPLYDAKRDFPDNDLPPTIYKDRVTLNNGVAAKINYSRDLISQLKELGSGVGAIDLPEIFDNSEQFVDQPFDRSTYADREDDLAKQDVSQLDEFIKNVKGKINRVESEQNAITQNNQITQEWDNATREVAKAINTLNLDPQVAQGMRFDELVKSADDLINEYQGEKGDDLAADKGIKVVTQKIDELREAKAAIQRLPDIHKRYKEATADSQKKATSLPTPEEMSDTYEEWAKDKPTLPIHKHSDKTSELEKAFMEFVKVKTVNDPHAAPKSARDWDRLHSQYQDQVRIEREKYESGKSKDKSGVPEKKKSLKAEKNKRKPDPRRVRSDESSYSRNELTTDDLDSELSDLAKEMDANI